MTSRRPPSMTAILGCNAGRRGTRVEDLEKEADQ